MEIALPFPSTDHLLADSTVYSWLATLGMGVGVVVGNRPPCPATGDRINAGLCTMHARITTFSDGCKM